jgi:F-type H+-transporting ATPase subunit b
MEGFRVLRMKPLLVAALFLLLSASSALASGDPDAHGLPWGNFALRVLNFALVIAVIRHFFGKKIVAFFKDRRDGIAEEIRSLEERKREAQKHLGDVEQRIADLDRECRTILQEHKTQGENMKAAIIAQAHKTAEQITASAKKTAENEINAAIGALRAEMADHIVAATETLLTQKLTAQEHAKLVDKYLTKVVIN